MGLLEIRESSRNHNSVNNMKVLVIFAVLLALAHARPYLFDDKSEEVEIMKGIKEFVQKVKEAIENGEDRDKVFEEGTKAYRKMEEKYIEKFRKLVEPASKLATLALIDEFRENKL